MAQRFILNEVSYFGPGARKELPEVLSRMGVKKALVTSDKGLIKVGTTKMVTDVLDEMGFPYEIYSEIKPNPTVTNVKQGVDAFKASGADCIIAIGGGSSMDTAKGIGIVEDKIILLTIHEGKFHQVKRMFVTCGAQVTLLRRVAIGGLMLDEHLKEGESRLISAEELKSIVENDEKF